MGSKPLAKELLRKAGITINGSSPGDIQVHNPHFFGRVLRGGSLALGESYMDGWWDAEDLSVFFTNILRARIDTEVQPGLTGFLYQISAHLFNLQSKSRAFIVGKKHYDVGNDLYRAMLDPRLTYTCGYWSGNPKAQTLDEAQEAKLDLVCRKLRLKKGDRVLDIGCGWGSFLKFAAEKYGIEGVGITVSKEQAEFARESCKGLPVEILLQDYRDTTGQYDHIVSLGMFEHVGYRNYQQYMKMAFRCLKPGGLFLLHTIGSNYSTAITDPWIHKYIFPNGMLPSIAQIGRSIERLFVMEGWHTFGPDYDKTLMVWYANFERAWPVLRSIYDERFHRMWKYYLLCSAGAFRARDTQLWQIVLSKQGTTHGYQSVR